RLALALCGRSQLIEAPDSDHPVLVAGRDLCSLGEHPQGADRRGSGQLSPGFTTDGVPLLEDRPLRGQYPAGILIEPHRRRRIVSLEDNTFAVGMPIPDADAAVVQR